MGAIRFAAPARVDGAVGCKSDMVSLPPGDMPAVSINLPCVSSCISCLGAVEACSIHMAAHSSPPPNDIVAMRGRAAPSQNTNAIGVHSRALELMHIPSCTTLLVGPEREKHLHEACRTHQPAACVPALRGWTAAPPSFTVPRRRSVIVATGCLRSGSVLPHGWVSPLPQAPFDEGGGRGVRVRVVSVGQRRLEIAMLDAVGQ